MVGGGHVVVDGQVGQAVVATLVTVGGGGQVVGGGHVVVDGQAGQAVVATLVTVGGGGQVVGGGHVVVDGGGNVGQVGQVVGGGHVDGIWLEVAVRVVVVVSFPTCDGL